MKAQVSEHESRKLIREAVAHTKSQRHLEAIASYSQAHELAPEAIDPLMGLSNLYLVTRQFIKARDALVMALQKDTGQHREYLLRHLAFAYREMGDHESAKHYLNCCKPCNGVNIEKAILLPATYSSSTQAVDHLFALHDRLDNLKLDAKEGLDPIFTPFYFAYLGILDDWKLQQKLNKKLRALLPASMPFRNRKTKSFKRVAFISGYFHNHSVGKCFVGLFEYIKAHHPEIEIVTYLAPDNGNDELTARIKACSSAVIRLPYNLSEARKLLCQSGADLLVYTDIGMDVFTWLLAMTRCAPKQAVPAGHPVSPGMDTIDYFISSKLLQTPDQQAQHLEKLVLLDGLITNYDRPQYTLRDRADIMPQGKRVYVCAATLFKVHPDMDQVIKGLLEADKDAVIMFFKFGDTDMHIQLMQRWHRQFPEHTNRIWFRSWADNDTFMSVLHHATAIIDTPWFGAGNTSYQALAAGTPIVCVHNPEIASMKNASTQAHYQIMDQNVSYGSDTYFSDKFVATDYADQVKKLLAVTDRIESSETDCLFNNQDGVKSFAEWLIGEDQK